MPRPVAVRVSYRNDAAWILRFTTAVRKDARRSEAWKDKLSHHLNEVAQMLLQAEAEDLGGGDGAAGTRKKGRGPDKAAAV